MFTSAVQKVILKIHLLIPASLGIFSDFSVLVFSLIFVFFSYYRVYYTAVF